MTNPQYQRDPPRHANDASHVATIISGVVMVLAVIVQIVAMALPLWIRSGYIWDTPSSDRFFTVTLHWVKAVQAFEILGLLYGLIGILCFIGMMVKGQRIWSKNPLVSKEKVIVVGLTFALFMAGLCLLIGYIVLVTNSNSSVSGYISLYSCILFLMGSGLSGKGATDILFYRE